MHISVLSAPVTDKNNMIQALIELKGVCEQILPKSEYEQKTVVCSLRGKDEFCPSFLSSVNFVTLL